MSLKGRILLLLIVILIIPMNAVAQDENQKLPVYATDQTVFEYKVFLNYESNIEPLSLFNKSQIKNDDIISFEMTSSMKGKTINETDILDFSIFVNNNKKIEFKEEWFNFFLRYIILPIKTDNGTIFDSLIENEEDWSSYAYDTAKYEVEGSFTTKMIYDKNSGILQQWSIKKDDLVFKLELNTGIFGVPFNIQNLLLAFIPLVIIYKRKQGQMNNIYCNFTRM